MRCSKCGTRIKRKSSFCIKCGAKVTPVPKKDKKNKKGKKKRLKARILIPAVLIAIVSALIIFLIFGGDLVPDKVKKLKAYTYITSITKDIMPEQIKSFQFPPDLSFKLPFELPNPANILGKKEVPDKKQIIADLESFSKDEKSKLKFDSLEIEKRITVEKEKKDTVYVNTETKNDSGTTSNYYRLTYKRHMIGGWKLDKVKHYNVEGEKTSVAGVKNKEVLSDVNLFAGIPEEWERSKIKVIEHYTNLKAGTDTVIVYMELKNDYVYMTGTKEITYNYNKNSKAWESEGAASKLTCLSIEPLTEPQTPS
jgi:hypothetical protein